MIWHWKSKCDHPLMTTMTRAWRMMMYITGEQGEQGASWENRVCGEGRSHSDASKICRTESQQRLCHWHWSPGAFSIWYLMVCSGLGDWDSRHWHGEDQQWWWPGAWLGWRKVVFFFLLGWRVFLSFYLAGRRVFLPLCLAGRFFFLFTWLAGRVFFLFTWLAGVGFSFSKWVGEPD